ncbi:MAG TPA: DUF5916 domain-containing protein [Bacteroidales bacterium]|nr:DUF5916 domain-containing protein [Bacteroidales bacterium]
MKTNLIIPVIISAFTLAVPQLAGQSQSGEKRMYETSFTDTPPVIDGMMNEDSWNGVEWGNSFIQRIPKENVAPSQQTSFKILYDNNNLYVFIRAHDSTASKISRRLSRRDTEDGDMVTIQIDSYYDQQTAFSFTAMASGTKGDALISQDGNNFDDSWNPVWYLATTIDNSGWSAEMRIPFSQLRFGKKDEHIWGIQIKRYLFRNQEESAWQFIPKGSPGVVHLFGELHGINNIKPVRQIELMPYALAKTERFEKVENDPFLKNGRSNSISAGLDGKIAVTNDFTLDFSVNPDFGQVEADPSEVNLTAFETYFSEHRPLFVEGKNIYQFQPSNTIVINNFNSDNLFYSRRIGRYPHLTPESNDTVHVKMPESTKILTALKLSGKTRNGLSVGLLESVTTNEKAEIDQKGIRSKEIVEPLTNYFVARVQQDFNKGETTLGGIVTAVNRDTRSHAFDYLHSAAYTGGVDFKTTWKERTWYLAGNVEFSNVRGKPEAITATQQSSAHYFQRPDADYKSVDTSLTSLSGMGSTVKFGRQSKKVVQFETSFTVRSPGLEFNDIGYMRYSDLFHHGSWLSLNKRDPFLIFNNFYLNTNYWMFWDFSGKHTTTLFNTNWHWQYKNHWNMNFNITRETKNVSNDLLRGGPAMHMPGSVEGNLNCFTDQSKKISLYAGHYRGYGDLESFRAHDFYGGLIAQPLNSLSLTIEPEYLAINSQLQYVQTSSILDENRYLFAQIEQKTMTVTIRLNYTINPQLSVEYYGQPFVSAGKYSHFSRITNPVADQFNDRYHVFTDEITYAPGTNGNSGQYSVDENKDGTIDYTISNPDFNFRQYRSNLVVRWEYLPGSTLFLVWSQGRTDSASDGNFNYGNDIRDLFQKKANNVFLIKLSYWLPI